MGASGVGNDRSKHPAATVTASTAGSLVWATGHVDGKAKKVTPDAGDAIVHDSTRKGLHETYWVEQALAPVAAAGTPTTLGLTMSVKDDWQMAAVEIPPAGKVTTPSQQPASSGAAGGGATSATTGVTYTYDADGNRTGATLPRRLDDQAGLRPGRPAHRVRDDGDLHLRR